MAISFKVAAAVILALLNYKVLPLNFHLRFWKIIGYHFYINKKQPKDLFEEGTYTTFCPLLEMDFNMHKSNSTYFSDMDMSRSVLMGKIFKKFYTTYEDPTVKLAKHEWSYTPLGSVSLVFRKEIKPYVRYKVISRVFGWNEKWLFVVTKFVLNGQVYAYGLSKYVFKLRRKTVPPATAIEACGLLTDEAKARNLEVRKYVDDALELEQIGDLI